MGYLIKTEKKNNLGLRIKMGFNLLKWFKLKKKFINESIIIDGTTIELCQREPAGIEYKHTLIHPIDFIQQALDSYQSVIVYDLKNSNISTSMETYFNRILYQYNLSGRVCVKSDGCYFEYNNKLINKFNGTKGLNYPAQKLGLIESTFMILILPLYYIVKQN